MCPDVSLKRGRVEWTFRTSAVRTLTFLAHANNYNHSRNLYCWPTAIWYRIELVPLQNGKHEPILCPVWVDFGSVGIESRFFCESVFFCTPPLNSFPVLFKNKRVYSDYYFSCTAISCPLGCYLIACVLRLRPWTERISSSCLADCVVWNKNALREKPASAFQHAVASHSASVML